MTRAALTKLLILVILAFIICLPEFFTLYRVSNVNFLCLPYQPCERGNRGKEGGNAKIGDAKIRKEDICDPSRETSRSEKWLQDCTQENQSTTTDPESGSWRGGEVPDKSWFMCETDMNMTDLHSKMSSSAIKIHVEVSVKLQLGETETLNLTLYSHSNHSSLHFHPPEEEEEEEDEGQKKAFYCCLPILPNPESTNQSRCLLWLANQTVLSATATEKLPWKRNQKDEWRCLFRALWLALLCVVMLTIVTTVLGKIYWRGHSCKKSKVHSAGYNVSGQQLNDENENQTKIVIPKGLSPIQEVDTQDDIETLLDGNVDYCYTGNLHHRIHPSITEQQE